MHKHFSIMAVSLALLVSCKRSSTPTPPAASPAANPTKSTSPRTPAAPEFVAVAEKIESTARSRTPPVSDIFDNTRLTASASFDFASEMVRLIPSDSDYRLLRVFNQDGKTHALCRLLHNNGGFTYHDWLLDRAPDGKIRAYQLYMANAGEYFSEMMNRIVSLAGPPDASGLPDQNSDIIKHLVDMKSMSAALREGRDREVLIIYERLPKSLQKEKVFLLQRLQAATNLAHIAPVDFQTAYADFEKFYPDDPCLDLHSITGYFITKDYPAMYRAIDRLERWTGGDPWLENLRATALLLEAKPGAPAAAEKILRAVLAEEPKLVDPHRQLVYALARQENYTAAVDALREYERLSGRKLTDLSVAKAKSLTTSKPYLDYRASQR
jgi:hypothetical protein